MADQYSTPQRACVSTLCSTAARSRARHVHVLLHSGQSCGPAAFAAAHVSTPYARDSWHRPCFWTRMHMPEVPLCVVHGAHCTTAVISAQDDPTQHIYSSLRPPGALAPGAATALGPGALFTTPAAGAQVADCTLMLSPGAQVSVAFLISFAAVEPDSQPPLVLACTTDMRCM